MTRARPRLPDSTGAVVLGIVGIVLVVLAAIGASSEDTVTPQFTYLNLGAGGVVLVGTASAIYLLGLRRAVRRRRTELSGRRRFVGLEGPRG
jgi:hypothetical protein